MAKSEVSQVIKAIEAYYYSEDPKPSKVSVNTKSVQPDKGDLKYYFAKVNITSDYIPSNPKTHSVFIRFRINDQGKVVGNSIKYLSL